MPFDPPDPTSSERVFTGILPSGSPFPAINIGIKIISPDKERFGQIEKAETFHQMYLELLKASCV